MRIPQSLSFELTFSIALLAFGDSPLFAGETNAPEPVGVTRQGTFKLTFAHADLIWLADPASPSATFQIKPAARPIATDFHITTRVADHRTPARRYFREARLVATDRGHEVRAFTREREKIIGEIDRSGRFFANEFYRKNRELLPSWPADDAQLIYDQDEHALYREIDATDPVQTETSDYLPLSLVDASERLLHGEYSIVFTPTDGTATEKQGTASLLFKQGEKLLALATAEMPEQFIRADAQLGSYDNQAGTYIAESEYRGEASAAATVTISVPGRFTPSMQTAGKSLAIAAEKTHDAEGSVNRAKIMIDGRFDDWRDIDGIDDARADVAPYLDYVPDVDLLEFKVSNDNQHIFLYARVAGRVGHTHPDGGRSYFYAYIDVDRNAETGFLPTRDDECYFGVDIGDDCEVQFEFVNNQFRKAFYGFCGLGGDAHVLRQSVTLGKSQYARLDENGAERAHYKSEYTFRKGRTEITEDLKLGATDTIQVAVSPDGNEVEVSSRFDGFLNDSQGKPILNLGQSVDIAAGMESDSKAYPGKSQWGADNTPVIRNYHLSALPELPQP